MNKKSRNMIMYSFLIPIRIQMYRTRAIIIRGLYNFYHIFEVHFFVLKGFFFGKFCPYVWLVFKSGFKSRAGYSGAGTVYSYVQMCFHEIFL